MGPENMATQIDGIGVIHLTIAIRPEICGLVDVKIRASDKNFPVYGLYYLANGKE